MAVIERQCGGESLFLTTGQQEIMIAGDGVPLDGVRLDFAAGAVKQLVMRYSNDYDLLHIQGQGSLLHPDSTATLPLIRGLQLTHLTLVYRAGQTHIRNHPQLIPPLVNGGTFAQVTCGSDRSQHRLHGHTSCPKRDRANTNQKQTYLAQIQPALVLKYY